MLGKIGGVKVHRAVLLLLAAVPSITVAPFGSANAASAREVPSLGWSDGSAPFVVHFWPDPVNVKNANFFLPNKDISFPAAGFPLEIERSYNSRSTADGPLGFGWSFNYDIYVRIGEDGMPEVVDADGFVCKFTPQGAGPNGANEMAAAQVVKAKKEMDERAGTGRDPSYYATLQTRLASDARLIEQMRKELQIKTLDLPEGTYVSTTRGVQQLVVKKDGYTRTFTTGITHQFYKSGKLRQMIDSAGNSLFMTYSKGGSGDLTAVSHSSGAKLEFQTGKFGKITVARDPSGKAVYYQYNDQGDLIAVKDVGGKITRYEYDQWHNMTKIVFPNGDTILNRYNPEKDWILGQKGPGDSVTSYEYGTDLADETHYWTIVDENGVKTRYDYYDRQNRVITTDAQGQKTDRTFSECCGKPLKVIEPDGRQVNYEYDKRGNATRIWDNRGQNVRYEYHPKWSKVSKVILPSTTLVYEYDAQGNLAAGTDAGVGAKVLLQYTPDGRVKVVHDGKGKQFNFKYNAAGKPEQIMQSGVNGAVVIEYGADGAVSSVKTLGQADQRQILGDLQQLIQIVEPAYKFEL